MVNRKAKAFFVMQEGSAIAVADKIGVDASLLSLIVNGHRRPTDDLLKRLRKQYGKRVDGLFTQVTNHGD